MKDPTIPNPKNRKKIMFYESPHQQTKLRIKCDLDGFTQSQFFRMMIEGYVENNELIISYIDQCKEKYNIQGINKRTKIKQLQKYAKETKKKFGLQADELEDIFDIIEMETGL